MKPADDCMDGFHPCDLSCIEERIDDPRMGTTREDNQTSSFQMDDHGLIIPDGVLLFFSVTDQKCILKSFLKGGCSWDLSGDQKGVIGEKNRLL